MHANKNMAVGNRAPSKKAKSHKNLFGYQIPQVYRYFPIKNFPEYFGGERTSGYHHIDSYEFHWYELFTESSSALKLGYESENHFSEQCLNSPSISAN